MLSHLGYGVYMTTKRTWRFYFPPTEDGVRGNHGPFDTLADGVLFPYRSELVAIPPSYPESSNDLFMRLCLEIVEGRPVCTMLAFEQQAEGAVVTPTGVRAIDVKEVIDQAIGWQAVTAKSSQSIRTWVSPGGVTVHERGLTDEQGDDVRSQALTMNRQRIVTDEFLREVATVYKQCDDGRPTAAVQDRWATTKRNASRWASEARKRGFLDPYVRSQARTSETKGN